MVGADLVADCLRGRVENGKSGGGIAYGYRALKSLTSNGEPERGLREIDEGQAAIIGHIFEDYAHRNKSPKVIAAALNKERIPDLRAKARSTAIAGAARASSITNSMLGRSSGTGSASSRTRPRAHASPASIRKVNGSAR